MGVAGMATQHPMSYNVAQYKESEPWRRMP